jgi:hypothetical protein
MSPWPAGLSHFFGAPPSIEWLNCLVLPYVQNSVGKKMLTADKSVAVDFVHSKVLASATQKHPSFGGSGKALWFGEGHKVHIFFLLARIRRAFAPATVSHHCEMITSDSQVPLFTIFLLLFVLSTSESFLEVSELHARLFVMRMRSCHFGQSRAADMGRFQPVSHDIKFNYQVFFLTKKI